MVSSRTTTTGQSARVATYRLTEPSTSAAKPPPPREPTDQHRGTGGSLDQRPGRRPGEAPSPRQDRARSRRRGQPLRPGRARMTGRWCPRRCPARPAEPAARTSATAARARIRSAASRRASQPREPPIRPRAMTGQSHPSRLSRHRGSMAISSARPLTSSFSRRRDAAQRPWAGRGRVIGPMSGTREGPRQGSIAAPRTVNSAGRVPISMTFVPAGRAGGMTGTLWRTRHDVRTCRAAACALGVGEPEIDEG